MTNNYDWLAEVRQCDFMITVLPMSQLYIAHVFGSDGEMKEIGRGSGDSFDESEFEKFGNTVLDTLGFAHDTLFTKKVVMNTIFYFYAKEG